MKIATSFLAVLLFTGTLGALNNAIADDGIVSKDELTAGSYDHEKSPAIQPSNPGTGGPTLDSAKTGESPTAVTPGTALRRPIGAISTRNRRSKTSTGAQRLALATRHEDA